MPFSYTLDVDGIWKETVDHDGWNDERRGAGYGCCCRYCSGAVWALIKIFPNRDGGDGTSRNREDNAEEILQKRFARGEIDAEEYERSLEVLKDRENVTKGGI